MKLFKKNTGLLVGAFVMLITCLSIVKAAFLPLNSVSLGTNDNLRDSLMSGEELWGYINQSLSGSASKLSYSIVDDSPRFFIRGTGIEENEYIVDFEYSGHSITGVSCKSQIFGYYYNPVFLENKLLPLNTGTKTILEEMDNNETSYIAKDINMTGGLYTNCEKESLGLDTGAVYGSIQYSYNSGENEIRLDLLAGIVVLLGEERGIDLVDELHLLILTGFVNWDEGMTYIVGSDLNKIRFNVVQVYGTFFDSVSNNEGNKSTITLLQFEKDVPEGSSSTGEVKIQWFNGAEGGWWLSESKDISTIPEEYTGITEGNETIELEERMNGKYICAYGEFVEGSRQIICSDNVIRVSETEGGDTGEGGDDEGGNTGEGGDDEGGNTGEGGDDEGGNTGEGGDDEGGNTGEGGDDEGGNTGEGGDDEGGNTGEGGDDEGGNTGEGGDDEGGNTGEGGDTGGHGSAQYIIEFQRDVPSTWSKTGEVTIKRNQSGHRKGRRLSSSNTPNDFPDPYESVENDTITISLTSGMNNKYICAFLRTGSDPLITGCSANRVRIDNENPELDLLSPNNRDFYSGYSIEFIWSGSDSVSWISGYVLTIYNPAGSQAYSRELSSNVTGYNYAVNEAGTWRWKVKACDRAVNCVEKSENFVVLYTGNVDYAGGFYLIRPMLWDKINLGNNITFSRNPGSQNSGYIREVSKVGGSTISGSTTSYSVTLNSGNFTTGTYFWSVYDKASGNSDVVPVFYVVDNGNNPDLKVNEFAFENKEYAEADKDYISNTIEIRGMTEGWYTLAYLEDSRGALYINGTFVGSRGYVKNGDDVSIELKASSRHGQTVESILVVGTGSDMVRGSYKVTTEEGVGNWESSSLSPLQKLRGVVFVDSLVELYQYNEGKLATFLSTFMQILEDKIDEYNSLIEEAEQYGEDDLAAEYKLYKNALAFLYTLVEYRYDSIEVEERTVYIAPNGRQYLVEYDETRMAYTSPDFVTRKYFPTWESFTNHIDKNNPKSGNWGIVGNVITTHNGKVYTIYETNGKWTSSNFRTAKYFDTKEDIINHILANNPASDWDHKIDTDFIQVSYTAPNGKIYRIFKTSDEGHNPNMYSSYDFINAKYFTSLEAAKKYINQNNKK